MILGYLSGILMDKHWIIWVHLMTTEPCLFSRSLRIMAVNLREIIPEMIRPKIIGGLFIPTGIE